MALIRRSSSSRQRTQRALANMFPGRELHSLVVRGALYVCSMYASGCITKGMHVLMHAYDVGHCPSIIKGLIPPTLVVDSGLDHDSPKDIKN